MKELAGKVCEIGRSSIGRKLIVALTGAALLGFVVGHMVGNLTIFLGREAINGYAAFLKGFLHGWGVWIARFGLLGAVVLHILCTIWLTIENKAAQDAKYFKQATAKASRGSRTMIVSGLTLLCFIIFHLLHFTVTPDSGDPAYYEQGSNPPRHDVYNMVVTGFSNVFISLFYIVSMVLLCFHISHGFTSMFQTLGLQTKELRPIFEKAGWALAGIILIGNCSIPLAVLFGIIQP